MKPGKYFDWRRGTSLTENEGCAYADWRKAKDSARFARLGDRMYIFLHQEEIDSYDKYRTGIFDLDLDESSAFHRLRIDNTLLLLEYFRHSRGGFSKLLDVGCGTGNFLAKVRQKFPDVEITGLEISLAALEYATRRISDADFVLADAYEPPFSPGYFDAILLNNVLEHVAAPIQLLKSLGGILVQGGCLVLSTPSRYRYENLRRVVFGKSVQFTGKDHVTEYTVGQVKDMLQYSGFKILKTIGTKRKPGHWTVRNFLSHYLLQPALNAWLQAVGSGHIIASTAFFLARKIEAIPEESQ